MFYTAAADGLDPGDRGDSRTRLPWP